MSETIPAPTIPMPGSVIALNKEDHSFKKSVSALNETLPNQSLMLLDQHLIPNQPLMQNLQTIPHQQLIQDQHPMPISAVPRVPQPNGNDSGSSQIGSGSHVADSGSVSIIRSQSAHLVDSFANPLTFSGSLGHFPFGGFALEESSSLAQIGKDPAGLVTLDSVHRTRETGQDLGKDSKELNILEMSSTDNFDLVDRKIRELYASMNKTSSGFEQGPIL